MLPYTFYKIVHLLGVITIFTVLGGIALHAMNGGTKQSNSGRMMIGILHGTALLLILVGGFGMMARLGMANMGFPGWLIGKLVIWGLIAVFGMLPYRKPQLARPALVLWPLLGGIAAWLVVMKPF